MKIKLTPKKPTKRGGYIAIEAGIPLHGIEIVDVYEIDGRMWASADEFSGYVDKLNMLWSERIEVDQDYESEQPTFEDDIKALLKCCRMIQEVMPSPDMKDAIERVEQWLEKPDDQRENGWVSDKGLP